MSPTTGGDSTGINAMHTLVIYESMYGNTHAVAAAISEGIQDLEARVVPVGEATDDLVAWADLVIVGGPTHARGMSTPGSRSSAVAGAAKPDGWSQVTVDPAATGPGVREWLQGLGAGNGKPAAAFDTRVPAPALITGRASSAIAKGLRDHGFRLVADPESFIVDTHQRLRAGETERAMKWGKALAGASFRRAESGLGPS
jgi:Flavodoxin